MSINDAHRQAIAALLLRNEQALLDPAVRRDRHRVLALLAEDFEEFGASGKVWSRHQIVELLASEAYDPPALEDFRCHLLAEDVALVTYRTIRANAQTGAPVATLRSSLWIEDSGEWRVRFHQGTHAI
jgi:hypothetical protein